MTRLGPTSLPPVGWEIASLAMGLIALPLTFLPVLGVPIGLVGLLMGLLGYWLAGSRPLARAAIGGMATCALALAANLMIIYAANGGLETAPLPRAWLEPPDVPYVAPPAPAGELGTRGNFSVFSDGRPTEPSGLFRR